MKSFYVCVYGCQMNTYDSRRIVDTLIVNGFSETNNINTADIVVFCTCNIREKAAIKLFSDIGRIKDKGAKIIAVGGCVAQAEGANLLKACRDISIVFGPQTYHNLPTYIDNILERSSEKVVALESEPSQKFECLPSRRKTFFSDFVSIQEGCNNFCTYCVVPQTRGREYSRPAIDILKEIQNLVSSGVSEVTLIGQNVNSYYGEAAYLTIGGSPKWRLERLLMEIANIQGLGRLRYTTSHPKDFPTELMEVHQNLQRLIPPFVHIPIQSGNNRILQAMNRGHTAQEYLSKLAKFRDICPNISFSSDFIVGFPGETEEEFYDTVKLAQEIGYSIFYAFIYSPRKNTPAYSMQKQISEKEKKVRLEILLGTLKDSQKKFNERCIGATQEILFEKTGKKMHQYVGKSQYMQSVVVESEINIIGSFRKVLIKEGHQNCLIGNLLQT